MTSPEPFLVGAYDYRVVALSILIAVLASYTALDLGGRVTAARGAARLTWLLGGGTAMGTGIWSMHYLAMLAFSLPVPVQYDWPTVLLSLLAGILSSVVALFVVSRREMGSRRAIAGSIFMGGGIVALHYIGMEAMRLPAMCHYSPVLVTLSVVFAIAQSLLSLWLAFFFRDEATHRRWRKAASILLMGAAISVMHYTGMAAASFTLSPAVPDLSHAVSISSLGTLAIAAVTVMVLGIALLTALVDRLQRQKALLDDLFEQAPAAVVLLKPDDRVVRVNRHFTRVFGYASHEAVGHRLSELIVPDEARDEYHRYADLSASGQRVEGEGVRQRKDGSRLHVSIIRVPVSVPGGQVAVYAMFQDITERKRAEVELRRNQSDLAEAQRVAKLGSWRLSIDSDKVSWSEELSRIFGLEPGGVGGTYATFVERIHPDDRALVQTVNARARAEGEPFEVEYRIITPAGELKTIREGGYPLKNERGRVIGLFGTAQDITEHKRIEGTLLEVSRRLLHAEDEERRRIAKELHDSTAQDLVAAMLTLDSLREGIAARSETEAQRLEDGLALLEKCAHDVRTLAYVLHPPRLDEAGLTGAIRHYAAGFGERTGIAVRVDLPADLRLGQDVELILFRVVQECLGNIHRHAGSPTAAISIRCDESSTVLEVSDAGRGLSPAITEVEGGPAAGTGVGIAGMRERLRQIGGRLEIHSGAHGTTVRAVLPVRRDTT